MLGITVRNIEGRVVGKMGGAIAGHFRIGEINPAFTGLDLLLQAEADYQQIVVLQTLGGINEPVIRRPQHRGEQIERGGRDQHVVAVTRAIGERNPAALDVDFHQLFSGVNFPGEIGGDAAVNLARSAVQRELEFAVRTPANIVTLVENVFQESLEIQHRNAVGDPGFGHLFERCRPDLIVVGKHEGLRNALPERTEDPVAKVAGCPGVAIGGSFGRADQATDLNIFRQVAQIALKRIGHPGFAFDNPALADALVYLVAQNLVDQSVEVRVVRKNDVTALIPDESVLIQVGSGVAADIVGLLVEDPIVVPQLVKPVSRAESGRSRSYDDNFLIRHRKSRLGDNQILAYGFLHTGFPVRGRPLPAAARVPTTIASIAHTVAGIQQLLTPRNSPASRASDVQTHAPSCSLGERLADATRERIRLTLLLKNCLVF